MQRLAPLALRPSPCNSQREALHGACEVLQRV